MDAPEFCPRPSARWSASRVLSAAVATATVLALTIGPGLAQAGKKRPAPRPDLVVKRGNLTIKAGRLVVSLTVKNTGSARAGASTAGIWTVERGSPVLLNKAPVGALSAGQSATTSVKVAITASLSTGEREISVCADRAATVREKSEANNCLDLGTVSGGSKVTKAVKPVATAAPADVPGSKTPVATPAPATAPAGAAPAPAAPTPSPTSAPTPTPTPTPAGSAPQPRPSSTVPSAPLAGFPQDDASSIDSSAGKYWLRVPPSYDASGNTPIRLLVWIHGCGGEASGEIYNVAPGDDTQNYIAMSPGGREGTCWDVSTDPAKVWAMVADLETHFNIDRRRIVLGGFSSGGDMAYRMAFDDAYDVAGVLAENTSPFGDSGLTASAIDTAYWKFNVVHLAHTEDDTYDLDTVRQQTTAMKNAGFPLTLVEKPGQHEDKTTDSDMQAVLLPHMHDDWQAPAGP